MDNRLIFLYPYCIGWLLKKDSGSLLRIEAKVLEVDGEVKPVII